MAFELCNDPVEGPGVSLVTITLRGSEVEINGSTIWVETVLTVNVLL